MSARFENVHTPLEGLRVLRRLPLGDHRGLLERMFCLDELTEIVGNRRIVQINRTITRKRGTLRGMHFQHSPHAEMKFVSCLRGEVLDVAVDVRPDSPTRYRWHGVVLSENNHTTLAIPEGFAHGFQSLTDDCEMLYFHTATYQPQAESGLNPRDPLLAIAWPLPIAEMSERDASHPAIIAP